MKLFGPQISEISAEPGTKVCVTHFDPRGETLHRVKSSDNPQNELELLMKLFVQLISEISAEVGCRNLCNHVVLRDKALHHVKSLHSKIVQQTWNKLG